MLPINLNQRAHEGDPVAIATLLNQALQAQEITASVDRQSDALNLRFSGFTAPHQAEMIAFVQQWLPFWQLPPHFKIRVFGYQTDLPAPAWSQALPNLSLETVIPENHTPLPAPTPDSLQEALVVGSPNRTEQDRFIVCGLGSLGQYSVLNLKRFALKSFEIHVTAIDQVKPLELEVPDLFNLLDSELILGDCRNDEMLLQAGIQNCRAILLVTSSDTVNIEAAIAARRLNPDVRLVVRSSRQNLNQLLRQQLGNFVAFEPTELPATAFALAGLSADILGYFKIGNCQLQVIEQQVQPRDFRFDQISAASMHKKAYRLLSYRAADASLTKLNALSSDERAFHQWQPDTKVIAGDTIAYIEVIRQSASTSKHTSSQRQHLSLSSFFNWLRTEFSERTAEFGRWVRTQQNHQVISVGLLIAVSLWLLGAIILKTHVPGMTWVTAFSKGFILLLGGYGDLFGGVGSEDEIDKIPTWVNFVCLSIALISSLFILGVFGFIADSLLTSRFDFLRHRLPIPKQNHVVIVGFGRVGQRVAALLQQFKQPLVAITEQLDNTKLLTQVPLVIGDINTELARVNLATAKSIMLLTEDQMLNLEIALIARNAAQHVNHNINLIIRTYNQRFSDNLRQLLPDAKAMAAYALSAEAFAGAAFGENILGLFRLNNRTVLVTEYTITADDTLIGKLLSQVTYGYGVVPILHQKTGHLFNDDVIEHLMPSDDVKLQAGDRLIVLASLNGLRRIEHGELFASRRWRLEARKPLNSAALLDAGATLHRISGYNLDAARAFINQLPGSLELSLYDHQAHRLRQELNRSLPATLIPL
jgi:Trk K+ transport system NAD-binding subunit